MLANGDMMTMEGMTQKHFQHRVPKDGVAGEARNAVLLGEVCDLENTAYNPTSWPYVVYTQR